MGITAPSNPAIKEILDALGLKNVTKFEMKMETSCIVSVDVTYYPDIENMKQLPAILRKYELLPRVEDVSTLGESHKEFQLSG